MATKKNQEITHEEVVTEAVSKTEQFFEKNEKLIVWVLVAVFVIIGGYFANKYLIAQPRAELGQLARVGTVAAANDEHHVNALRQLLRLALANIGGLADAAEDLAPLDARLEQLAQTVVMLLRGRGLRHDAGGIHWGAAFSRIGGNHEQIYGS